jgi:hypothetical protein
MRVGVQGGGIFGRCGKVSICWLIRGLHRTYDGARSRLPSTSWTAILSVVVVVVEKV